MQHSYKDFMSSERKYASWKINCLFFMLSASYVTLWPWVPLILLYAGCTLSEIGLILFLLHILSIFSVKLALSSINITKNGRVRRFLLFSLAALAFVFGLTALLLTPFPKSEMFCANLQTTHEIILHQNDTSQLFPKLKKDGNTNDVHDKTVNNSDSKLLHKVVKLNQFVKKSNGSDLLVIMKTLNNTHSHVNIEHNTNFSINSIETTGEKVKAALTEEENMVHNDKNITTGKNNFTLIQKKPNKKNNTNSTYLQKYDSLYDDYDQYDDYDPTKLHNNFPLRKSLLQQMDSIDIISDEYDDGFHKSRLSIIPFHYPDSIQSITKYIQKIPGNNNKQVLNAKLHNIESYKSAHKISKRSTKIMGNLSNPLIKRIQQSFPQSNTLVLFSIITALLLSLLLGGGIEIAISKLWHCCIYGIPHDNGLFDGIDYNIVPAIKSPFMGDHKVWSLWASCLWLLFTTIAILITCGVGLLPSPFNVICIFFFISELVKCFMLLIIYIPYGDLCTATCNRTLGLYLDNEVIEEGLRRITFQGWIIISGIIISLPSLYTILLIQEVQATQREIWIAQTAAISALILGEAIILVSDRWLTKKFNLKVMICATGVLIAFQNIILWKTTSIWIKSASPLLAGIATSILWLSVATNSQTLGTSETQQKEAWISWICFKCGMGIGSVVWLCIADTEWCIYTLHNVLPVSAIFSITTSCVILITYLDCRGKTKSKRIYHTLDIGGASEDETDDAEINMNEADWLIRCAKKEGFKL